jgi:hydrogenase-4 transcriptional activator
MSLEAKLWREVGQHLELDESAQRLAVLLSDYLPVKALVLRRLERNPYRLTTVAVASPTQALDESQWPARSEFEAAAARELTRFVSAGELRVLGRPGSAFDQALLPASVPDAVVAAPLSAEDKPVGVVLFVFDREREPSSEQLELLAGVLGPLGVAFENDQRLHELARMREALEADREALLSRLQRQDISEAVIGESAGLQNVMQRVEQVAPTDAPVLILGETGAGKEVIARAIHTRSRRDKGPVVRINCGAIPSELVDSELFGHEKGSFTGAVAMRKGWFERADGGTLFLDEIGELPLAAQVRLLRVLQDGTLERVGGHQIIHVDVRIVAATHRNLEIMVSEGMFREDLWYRLSVFPIRLPALRERPEDIPAFATHFAERAGKRLNGVPLVPTPSDIDQLLRYAWPGNVRELAAVIERAAILGSGKRLEIATALGAGAPRAASVPPPPPVPQPHLVPLAALPTAGGRDAPPLAPDAAGQPILTLDAAMAAHIERVLHVCHGRIEGPFGAAKLLGINPHTLRARMRKLGVDWSRYRGAEAARV